MLTSSNDIKRRLEREGWALVRTKGSHHILRNPETGVIISLPRPKRDLGRDLVSNMAHYVAVVEEEEDKAIGVWFPDLPGCVSEGDTLDEAMQNAAVSVKSNPDFYSVSSFETALRASSG